MANPKSKIPNPQYKSPNPKPKIGNPQFAIPQSNTQSPLDSENAKAMGIESSGIQWVQIQWTTELKETSGDL